MSVDALSTSSCGLLATYQSAMNYQYLTPIEKAATVDLGHGAIAELWMTNITQIDTQHQEIFQMLTFSQDIGNDRYQRLTFFTPVGRQTWFSVPDPSAPVTSANLRLTASKIIVGSLPSSELPPDAQAYERLVAFARSVVAQTST